MLQIKRYNASDSFNSINKFLTNASLLMRQIPWNLWISLFFLSTVQRQTKFWNNVQWKLNQTMKLRTQAGPNRIYPFISRCFLQSCSVRTTVTQTTASSSDTVNSIMCGSLSVLKINLARDLEDTKPTQTKIISYEASLPRCYWKPSPRAP